MGGGELAILLPDMTSVQAMQVTKRPRRAPSGCLLAGQMAAHSAFGTADLVCNVHEVSASLVKLPYHEKVLSAQHGAVLTGLVTSKERSCGSGGQSVLMIYGLIAPASTQLAQVRSKDAVEYSLAI